MHEKGWSTIQAYMVFLFYLLINKDTYKKFNFIYHSKK